jgi:nucleoside-diphosphate-sugar epimerase
MSVPAIVVTGALGQLGRHTIARLVEHGCTVHAYDCRTADDASFETHMLDLAHPPSSFAWPANAETVLHLAGYRDVTALTAASITQLLEANLAAVAGMLAACGPAVRNVVYVSSMSVYAPGAPVPSSEDAPIGPDTLYGVSKWLGEQMCRIFQRARDVEVTILRLAQVYGPGSPAHLALYRLIDQALEDGRAELNCRPELQRDLIHLDDAARALALAAEQHPPGVYNVTTGRPCRMDELLDAVEAALGRPLQKKFGTAAGIDRALCAARFHAQAGFVATVSLREGVQRELERMRSRRGGS